MSKEPVALLEVTPGENGKECRYKTLAEDLPIGTHELYLSTPEPEQDDEPVATLDHNGNFELLKMVGVTFGQPIYLYALEKKNK